MPDVVAWVPSRAVAARETGPLVAYGVLVQLGGVADALMHSFEAWAVYDSLEGASLSILFLAFQDVPPGMVKSVLTLRTGNAWVHA